MRRRITIFAEREREKENTAPARAAVCCISFAIKASRAFEKRKEFRLSLVFQSFTVKKREELTLEKLVGGRETETLQSAVD